MAVGEDHRRLRGLRQQTMAFVIERFKKHQSGEIARDSIREYVKERNEAHRCLDCDRAEVLTQTVTSHPVRLLS